MRVEPLTVVVIMVALLLALSGCATMKQSQREAVTSVLASSSGYVIGDKKPELIKPFLKWSDNV